MKEKNREAVEEWGKGSYVLSDGKALQAEVTMHNAGRKCILGRKNNWQNRPKRSSSKSLRQEKIG